MSIWASVEAQWTASGSFGSYLTEDFVLEGSPQGSEGGGTARKYRGEITYDARLRDFDDMKSPSVLAWFLEKCAWLGAGDEATLLLEIESGPRYRYVFKDGKLERLKGVLES